MDCFSRLPFSVFRHKAFPRIAPFAAALACALVTAALCSRGIHWALMHPDEPVVERRTRSELAGHVMHKQVFPAGYYRLATAMDPIDALARDAARGVSGWMRQEGADGPVAVRRAEWPPQPLRPRLLMRIREWNVLLAALSSFLVFYLLRTLLGGGIAIPTVATLVYAAHPFVVEHAHYAETDAAMLATGAAAFLLMAQALRRERPWLLVAAGAAAGFTVSMKFSYLLFAAVLPVEAVALARRRGAGARSAAALAFGSLGAMLAGYLAGTPMLLLAPRTYLALSRAENARVYSENARVLQRLADIPFPNLWVKGRAMVDEAGRLGWGWWLWAAAAAPLWFSRRMRRLWPSVPMFGFAYAPFAFFVFPWFRQQEFLPMIPFLVATIALPAAFPLRGRRLPAVVRCLALAVLCAAAFSTFRDGVRVSSAFATVETRVAMGRWLALCAPSGRNYGVENYAETGNALARRLDNGPPAKFQHIGKVEAYDPAAFAAIGLDYFLRTPDRRGRFIYDPRTGRRFPEFQRNRDATLGSSCLLRTWCAAPDNRPKFSQVGVQLYGRPDDGPAVADIPAVPAAPLHVYGQSFGDAPDILRFGADSPHVGPVEAIQLTRIPVAAAFDPLPAGGRYYAVAINFSGDEDATVRWNRGFSPARASVPPHGAALFTSTHALASPWRTVAMARVKSDRDGLNDLCLLAVTSDRALAASLLRRHGAPDAAATLGSDAPEGSPLRTEALLAAGAHVADALVPALAPTLAPGLAPALVPTLASALASARAALGNATSAPGISLCGLPLRIHDDFARICLPPFAFGPRPAYPGIVARLRSRGQEKGWLWAEFPTVLEPGHYALRLFLSNDPRCTETACGGDCSLAPLPAFAAIGASVRSARATGWARDGSLAVELSLDAEDDGVPLAVGFAADRGITSLSASGATLRWHPADLVGTLDASLPGDAPAAPPPDNP